MDTNSKENKTADFWEKAKVFEKSVEKSVETPAGQSSTKDYVFYDGPPFATGLPHYGHIVASIIKDVVPRFWTMKGFRVERKWGWDCHGLPIENIVEKELGTKTKKEIEEIGVDKFNKLCEAKVLTYVEDWKKVIKKLGRWADMENSYKTMDKDFMESVWWVFKDIYDKGLVYKGYRAMHICPRCETTLSQSEVTEGYKDVKDLSVIAKFQLVDEPETYILAWTTTPWTLIANVALAVGKDIDYIKIESESETYILAKTKLEELFKDKKYKIIEELKGKDLVGKSYVPLFDYYSSNKSLENFENGWKIYAGDFVTTDEGTGVVHIAPAFGEDDMKLGEKYNLPFVQHIGMDGIIKDEATDFAGLSVKPSADHMATDIQIMKLLSERGLLFSKAKYEHSYPHCWRCDTPLLNYATSSWFVDVTKIKDRMLETAEDINWSPEHIKKGRWGNWLLGARDWAISRQRFWASVIPIWECACGERKVIGSIEELEKLGGKKVKDLHKHTVDKIKIPCSCGKKMKRIPDVLDCWFESGAMPYAQMHYPFENREKFEKNFPAQFIAEGADQTRCWFYYLHILSNAVKNTRAFNNVIVNGIVLAEDGKKMSKRLQNYPDPMVLMEKYGADALRYYLLTSPVMMADNLNFSEKGVQESYRKVNMILSNVYSFYKEVRVANVEVKNFAPKDVLNKWILARLNELIKEVSECMEKYNLPSATRPIATFVEDLSTWYLRQKREQLNEKDEESLKTLTIVFDKLVRTMAPFTPFIAEEIWQDLHGYDYKKKDKSVHLEAWPKTDDKMIDKKLLEEMKLVREIVSLGLKERDQKGVGLKWPLQLVSLSYYKPIDEKYYEIIKQELNVKEIEAMTSGEEILKVSLDFNVTPELEAEGYARELSRKVQAERKNLGLQKTDFIELYVLVDKEFKKVLEFQQDFIKERTNSKEVMIYSDEDKDLEERFKKKVDFKIKDKKGAVVIIV